MAQTRSQDKAGEARTPEKPIGQVVHADNKLAEKSELEGPAAYAPLPKDKGAGADKGDEGKPDEPIGEVAYANRDPAKKKTGEF